MNISQITSKNNIKSTLFQTLVILLHSLKVLTSKVYSKDVKLKKRIIFGFFAKFCQNYAGPAGVTYPCGDVIFFKS
jgi:hypothetical protein